MTRFTLCAASAALFTVPAAAQVVPGSFPVDRSYKAVSIGTRDVQSAGITLRAQREADGRVRSFGTAGCNRWTASATIREHVIDFSAIATTKMACSEPRMTSERAFLHALQSARRWRIEGAQLIIEGGGAPITFIADRAR
jgi:heat shock protein HslJ